MWSTSGMMINRIRTSFQVRNMASNRASKMFRREISPLERVERLHNAGFLEKLPPWYSALKECPTAEAINFPDFSEINLETSKKMKKTSRVTLMQRLLYKYYKRNPVAKKTEVFNLFDQTKSPPGVIFVKKQMELMKSGLSEQQAYDKIIGGTNTNAAALLSSEVPSDDEVKSLRSEYNEWMNTEGEIWDKLREMKSKKKTN